MSTSTTEKYPVAIFELIPSSKNGANFIREDTINSKEPIRILHPKNRVIQNTSIVKELSEDPKLKKDKIYVDVPIRYVYGSPVIRKDLQESAGIKPNPQMDSIVFKNGLLTVPKDGPWVGLYEYMTSHAQNETNPNRIERLPVIFREIKPAEDAHNDNRFEFEQVEALSYIKTMVTEKEGKYVYNEDRIDVLSVIFNVSGESPEQKVAALIAYAKLMPKEFLDKAKASEQTMLIEIDHGLKLEVISFEGQTAIFVRMKRKIKEFTSAKNEDALRKALADHFGSQSGAENYQVFKAELAAAKEAKLSQQ